MPTPPYWDDATHALCACDPVLAKLTKQHQGLMAGSRGDAFSTLARAIVGQQISVKAAQSVWDRLVADLRAITPAAVASADVERLRACGLSRPKARYLLDLAQHFRSGALDPTRFPALDDETLIAELTQVKGIGRWTAEMFLIFYMTRPDVLPVDDVGLQRAMSLQYNNGKPVSAHKMRRIARAWAPWRSVATWYLWRSLDAQPVQY